MSTDSWVKLATIALATLLLAGCLLEVDARYNRGQETLERAQK
jgi:hypothetical protein